MNNCNKQRVNDKSPLFSLCFSHVHMHAYNAFSLQGAPLDRIMLWCWHVEMRVQLPGMERNASSSNRRHSYQ